MGGTNSKAPSSSLSDGVRNLSFDEKTAENDSSDASGDDEARRVQPCVGHLKRARARAWRRALRRTILPREVENERRILRLAEVAVRTRIRAVLLHHLRTIRTDLRV